MNDAVEYGRTRSNDAAEQSRLMMDRLAVNFGVEILKIVPGRVSTEVDARLSYDTEGTIARAMQLMGRYDAEAVSKDWVLIKIASTWEGIRAAEVLEREGIHCSLTLMFGFPQAVACADAGVTLISPFVGRISDWFKLAEGIRAFATDASKLEQFALEACANCGDGA